VKFIFYDFGYGVICLVHFNMHSSFVHSSSKSVYQYFFLVLVAEVSFADVSTYALRRQVNRVVLSSLGEE